jgi:glycogen synthase kinase 3 beta
MYLAMELLPATLADVIRGWARSSGRTSRSKTKLYAYQLTRALAHIHGMSICHRDVKPQNILVNPTSGMLKLADFGSSKVMCPGESNTSYISSRFYRAPECMLDNSAYSTAIDIWALGCVVAEMIALRPVFPGEDNQDQLYLIMKARGTPSAEDFEYLNPELEADVVQSVLQRPRVGKPWNSVLGTDEISHGCKLLLDGLLCWSPQDRLKASQAMAHPYFGAIQRQPEHVLKERSLI